MSENIRYRLAITEYTTLKGFGISHSLDKEFENEISVKSALNRSIETLAESIPGSHIQHNGTMGYMIINNDTGLVLINIMAYPYVIDENNREYCYRGHKITTEFDPGTGEDVLLIHRLYGRPYIYRFNLMGALDFIDWIWCTIDNSNIARQVLDNTNKEKEGN